MSRTGEDRGRATGIHPGLGEMVAWAAAYVLCDLMVRHLALAGSHIVLWYPAAGDTLAWLVRAGIRGAPILIAARSL
ncbi:MAG: hypothetical protein JF602_09440, partial [Gemmatimonadetes bacterium]|nr:hypothetical protein [Gemmatimonadota bacterium]